ncbi:uncharacterized protein KIAA2012 homolog [Amazona ochrocephala]
MKDCLGLPLPETYTARMGALILYSENLAELSWKKGGRMGLQGHKHRGKPQIKLQALQDLTRAILAYGRYAATPLLKTKAKKHNEGRYKDLTPGYAVLTVPTGHNNHKNFFSSSALFFIVTKTLTTIFISFTFLTPGALCYTSKPETSSHENLLAPSLYDLISGPESTAKQHQMAIGGYPDIHQGSFTQSPTGNQEFALEERKVEARRVNASMKGLYKKGHSACIRKDCLCLMLQLHFSYKTNKFVATHS